MALVKADEVQASFEGMSNLKVWRQIGLLIGLAASIATAVVIAYYFIATPSYGVLYAGLEKQDVSTVLDALRQSNIDAKIDENSGAILVPAKDVHNARIKLAAEGLPKGVSAGFADLDQKNSFGISQFMEKARYQHALEVELSRTIMSLSSVRNARVHLAIPRQSVFVRNRKKPQASVTVTLFPGRVMEKGQVSAIVHLVAASVPNMEADKVTVVDHKGKLLTNGSGDKQLGMDTAQFDYTRRIETSYIDRIEDILEPVLGPGASRAQVTADIDFTMSEQTQELYNPDTPALRSNQTTEERTTGGAMGGGVPGALSNQPPGAASAPESVTNNDNAAANAEVPSRSHRREIRNFELDKTISHTRYAMGNVRRLSVAVVVDDKIITGEDGQPTRMPRTPEELDRLTELVKKAVGFSAQRGDSVNVINSSFTVPAEPEALPEPPMWEQAWIQDMVKNIMGGILILALYLMVFRPVMKSLAKQQVVVKHEGGEGEQQGQLGAGGAPALGADGAMPALGAPNSSYEQKLQTATKAVEQDPKLVAQVVKNWVAADG
jgi:flagellar M-ring protein FliF